MAVGTLTTMVGAQLIRERDLAQRRTQKRRLNDMSNNNILTEEEQLSGENANILTKRIFLYHLTDGITEVLWWDNKSVLCRGVNSVSEYYLDPDSWKIMYPLNKEQKEWLIENILP